MKVGHRNFGKEHNRQPDVSLGWSYWIPILMGYFVLVFALQWRLTW
jgi:hypothetical protein